MPLIIEFQFTDGTSKTEYIPAEIWRYDADVVTKVFVQEKEAKQIILDPRLETADTDMSNNYFPPQAQISKFELFKQNRRGGENPMQRAERAKKMKN